MQSNFIKAKQGFFHCKCITTDNFSVIEKPSFIVFGLGSDARSSRPGSRFGVQLLRSNSLDFSFRSKSFEKLIDLKRKDLIFSEKQLYDLGDVDLNNFTTDVPVELENTYLKFPLDAIPIMIGGDHSYTYHALKGSLNKHKDEEIILVQFDHHLDIQMGGRVDNVTGQPVLSRLTHGNFVSWLKKDLPSLNIFQIGVSRFQDILPTENLNLYLAYLQKISTKITSFDILTNPLNEILSQIPIGKKIYLSIDVDVLSSHLMSATGYPAHTGLDFRDLMAILLYLCRHNKVIGIDIMEFGTSHQKEFHQPMSTRINTMLLAVISEITFS